MPTTRSQSAAAAAADAARWVIVRDACRHYTEAHSGSPLPFIIHFSIRVGTPEFEEAFAEGWLAYARGLENKNQ